MHCNGFLGELKEDFMLWISEGHKVTAIEGFYGNIAQYDFDMLYPTIAYEFKIDPISVIVHDEGFPVVLYQKLNDRGEKGFNI